MLDRECQRQLESWGVARGRLLVAVSGGRDSCVLLELLARMAPRLDLELVVGHVNHRLRGAESDADEAAVAAEAGARGLAFRARTVDPETLRREAPSSRARPTLEEAGRGLRRDALLEIAGQARCRWIATAHHAGDQAETLLMRILRGTGPDGLAGIPGRSTDGRWIRPMLGMLPEAIEDWARAQQLVWREDASNQDRRFTRNRLRHDVLPGLAETFNPQLLRTLSHLAEAQREDVEWIESIVAEAAKERIELAPSGLRFAIDGWNGLPDALARRLVRYALHEVGLRRDVTRVHLQRVLEFLRRGRRAGRDKSVQLPQGFRLQRRSEVFELVRDTTQSGFESNENATVQQRD